MSYVYDEKGMSVIRAAAHIKNSLIGPDSFRFIAPDSFRFILTNNMNRKLSGVSANSGIQYGIYPPTE